MTAYMALLGLKTVFLTILARKYTLLTKNPLQGENNECKYYCKLNYSFMDFN